MEDLLKKELEQRKRSSVRCPSCYEDILISKVDASTPFVSWQLTPRMIWECPSCGVSFNEEATVIVALTNQAAQKGGHS